MNILFIDIDGVLITSRTLAASTEEKRGRDAEFDPVGMGLIKNACDKYGCKIVICSSWKNNAIMSEGEGPEHSLYNQFNRYNMIPYLHQYWKTKDLRYEWDMAIRGDEIKDWLKNYGASVNNYVILDDIKDYYKSQIKNHLIHVCPDNGISWCDFKRIGKIFKSNRK